MSSAPDRPRRPVSAGSWTRLHRWLFRVWMPRAFREEMEGPALAAFDDLMAEARRRSGRRGVALLLGRELVSLVRCGWSLRFGGRRFDVEREGAGSGAGPGTERGGGEGRTRRWRDDLRADLRSGLRALWRRPGFTVVALTAIALGVGMNTATFSLADAVFLRPLAYPSAERMGVIGSERLIDGSRFSVSHWELSELEQRSHLIERMAPFLDWQSVNLSGGDRPERISVNYASAAYFEMLGFSPILGRLVDDGDGDVSGGSDERRGDPVVVISHPLWQERFGGDPDVVGRTVVLDGLPFVVIGVLGPEVSDLGQRLDLRPEAYLPLAWSETLIGSPIFGPRGSRYLFGLVRWRSGVELGEVRAELDRVSRQLAAESPDSNEGRRLVVDPVAETLLTDVRESTWVLLVGAGFVLLLVCANLAGLLLVQGSDRVGELAVRRALGAGRGRVVRQLMTEGLVLGLLGGVLGVVVASVVLRLLSDSGALDLPTFVRLELDARTLAAAFALSLVTGLLVGWTPALRAGRVEALDSLRGGRSRVGAGRARAVLLAAQVALAVILMSGSVLLIESLRQLRSTDLGFDPQRLLVARLDLQGERYLDPEARTRAAVELLDAARGLPGIDDALLWGPSPIGGGNWIRFVTPEGRYAHEEERIEASRHHLLPGALGSLGLPILRGRDLSSADRAGTAPVVLVSESLARRLWADREAVGRRLHAEVDGALVAYEVIGVVGDAKHRLRLDDFLNADLDLYVPLRQEPVRHLSVLARYRHAGGGPRAEEAALSRLTASLRRAVAEVDPELPLHQVATVEETLAEEEARSRLAASLVTGYALLAMALSALGTYGVLGLSVRQRSREIGLRLALGARARDILRQVAGEGARVFVIGAAVGIVGAFVTARWLGSVLYGATSLDAGRLTVVIAGLALVGGAGLLLPARAASRIEPTAALVDD